MDAIMDMQDNVELENESTTTTATNTAATTKESRFEKIEKIKKDVAAAIVASNSEVADGVAAVVANAAFRPHMLTRALSQTKQGLWLVAADPGGQCGVLIDPKTKEAIGTEKGREEFLWTENPAEEQLRSYARFVARQLSKQLAEFPDMLPSDNREYAKICTRACKGFQVPFALALTIGPIPAALVEWKRARKACLQLTGRDMLDLKSGVNRRRDVIYKMLCLAGVDDSKWVTPLSFIGQIGTQRLAQDIINQMVDMVQLEKVEID